MSVVSIIMPLFNAQKYLSEALQSLAQQKYADYELICINDGSTDATMDILYSFARNDGRIRIMQNRQRMGAACSRNCGIKEARGEYMIFLDGDDIFDEVLLERAVDTMEKHNADIVLFDFMHVTSESIYEKKYIHHGKRYRQKYCTQTFRIEDNAPYECLLWSPATWNKMYRTEFILKNKLEFQDIQSSNDVYFSYMALFLSERIIVMDDERVMVYARDHAELSRISNNRNPLCGFMALEKLQQELIDRNKFEDMFQHFYLLAYFFLKSSLYTYRNTEREKELYDFLQSEGIETLCRNGVLCFDQTDKYIRQQITCFQTKSYHTKWYEIDNLLDFYLRENKQMVCDLFTRLRKENKKVCIWGVGRNGYSLLKFLMENHIEVDLVVDKDARKHGDIIGGYTISDPANVRDGIDVIIVSGLGIMDYVKVELDNVKRQFEYIDINMLLGIV